MPDPIPIRNRATPWPIVVIESDRDRWQSAVSRARRAGVFARHLQQFRSGLTVHRFSVPSSSQSNLSYQVDVEDDAGETRVSCPCIAGAAGRICMHAAAAIHAAGLFPFDVFVTGQRVQIPTGDTGVIDHTRGHRLRVADPDRHLLLGWFTSAGLRHAPALMVTTPEPLRAEGVRLLLGGQK